MRVVDVSALPDGSQTRSMQTLGSLLNMRPEMSKSVVTLYPNLSLTSITEALGKIYGLNDSAKVKNLTPIRNMAYEWMIKSHQIPIIRFSADNTATGIGFGEFTVLLEKKYYSPYDTFKLKNGQMLFVTRMPQMLNTNTWRYYVKVVGNNPNEQINTTYTTKGQPTQYVSNYFPELSERGYNKYMYNIEKHRNYLSRHRQGDSYSSDWGVLEQVFLEHAGMFMKMDNFQKSIMDTFYMTREGGFVFGKTNYDINGKCMLQDDQGRDIPMGDGLFEQLKKYCSQQTFTSMTREILNDAIADVVAKLPNKTGNTIMCMTGFYGYQLIGTLLENIATSKMQNAFFWTKDGKKVVVGAEFSAYTFQGNTIVFTVNNAFDTQISETDSDGNSLWSQTYVFFDTGMYDGEPNISLITMDGRSLITGNLKGMGGLSGKESGDVATTLDGSRVEVIGYASLKVANPYSAHIIRKVVVA